MADFIEQLIINSCVCVSYSEVLMFVKGWNFQEFSVLELVLVELVVLRVIWD